MTPRLAGLGFAAVIATAVSAQQPAPTFRTQVDAVQVDVFVTDRDGNPVRDLRLDDFELLEDGRPQTITSFSEVNIPITVPPPLSPGTPRPDVATNSGGEGRLYVIALDEVGADLALRARHFLTTFIERHFEPNDVGVVVNVGRASSAAAQDFTSDRGLLLAAINRLQGGFGVVPSSLGEPWRLDRSPLAQRSRAAALKALIASLTVIQGRRKALIYITQEVGDVYSVIDYKGGVRSHEFDDLRAAMTEAMRGGVAIYTIDPCGLTAGGSLGETETNVAVDCDADLERMAAFRKLSEATGGFAVVNSNSFGQALERMVKENSSYYVLGFTSTNDRRDGRYRRLEVRAKRPGLTIRARDGYIAPSRLPSRPAGTRTNAPATAGIRDVIASPLANGGVPMKVFAAAFKGPRGNEAKVVVTAEFDASRLGFAATGGTMRAQIELASAAVSAAGKVTRGQPQVIDLALKPDSYAQALAHGFRTQAAITLPPGRYQLRVAGGNRQGAKIGSVMYDLDVPDFGKGRLAMSAVALSTMDADRPVTVVPAAANVLPFFPTLSREFVTGTRISLYVEAYNNARGRDPKSIELKVDVRDRNGQAVRSGSDRRTRATQGTETFVVAVPLDVGAGDYSLHLEATSGEDAVSRDIPIRVR
jgi:VWFA-related protein